MIYTINNEEYFQLQSFNISGDIEIITDPIDLIIKYLDSPDLLCVDADLDLLRYVCKKDPVPYPNCKGLYRVDNINELMILASGKIKHC